MQTPTDPHSQRLSEHDPGGVPRDRRSVLTLPGSAAIVWLGVISVVIGALLAMEHWTRTAPPFGCPGGEPFGFCWMPEPPLPFGMEDALFGLAWAAATFAVLLVAATLVVSLLHRQAPRGEGAGS